MRWFHRWLAIHALDLDPRDIDATVRFGETVTVSINLDPIALDLTQGVRVGDNCLKSVYFLQILHLKIRWKTG